MPKFLFRSQLKDTIPTAFPFWPTSCENVHAYGGLRNTVVLESFMTNVLKECMLCENIAYDRHVRD